MNEKNLNEKAQILAELVKLTSKLYKESNDSQRAFLETLIGAGIWYLPSDKKLLFNGKISQKALEKLKTDAVNTKLVEEHFIPRKIAGNELYNEHLDEISNDYNNLVKLYLEKFGRFNYVLKTENSKLGKYQRVGNFIDEDTAYKKAEIEMIPIDLDEIEELKKKK